MSRAMGFTGTEAGMTGEQMVSFTALLKVKRPTEFHHGMCEGADEEAHKIVRMMCAAGTIPPCAIIGHPGVTKDGRVWKRGDCPGCDEVWEPLPFLVRNVDIVRVTDELVAAPEEAEEILRSGTWTTVRRARNASKPISIIVPDGTISSFAYV